MAIERRINRPKKRYTQKLTTWRNDLDVEQKFDLLLTSGELVYVVIEPGQEEKLDSCYDDGIKQIHPKSKEVIGGAAPRLTMVGHEELELSPNLDYERIEEEDNDKKILEDSLKAEAIERMLNKKVKEAQSIKKKNAAQKG